MNPANPKSTGAVLSDFAPSVPAAEPIRAGGKPRLKRLERIRLQLIDRLVLAAALVAVAYVPMLA